MIWSCTSCTWERSHLKARSPGATARLPALRDLGVTAIELMPVADFPGERNWGYDGVCLYAPSRAYGRPDDLRRLVDRAHALGISVVLDVVYNHLGPEGAYLPEFYPAYFTGRHSTPWGRALNFDDRGADIVRRLVTDNASYWIREYHLDGLRLDATHALVEDDSGAIVREIVHAARAASSRPVFIHAEDHRNLAAMLEDPAEGGWGVDGVWADDFHHVMRRLLAGDEHSYYSDYEGTTDRAGPDDPPGLALHRSAVGTPGHESRHGSVANPDATLCHLPSEPRPDREPRNGRPAARQHLARRLARRERRPAHGADDAAALHGSGVGSGAHRSSTSPISSPGWGTLSPRAAVASSRASPSSRTRMRATGFPIHSRRRRTRTVTSTGPKRVSRHMPRYWRSIGRCWRCGSISRRSAAATSRQEMPMRRMKGRS